MAERSWFVAFQGQQQGPYPEARLRELIAEGSVTADTLVWSQGMSSWVKAGEVPGLPAGARGRAKPFEPGAAGPDASLASNQPSQESAVREEKTPEIAVTLPRILRIYWLFLWRSVLGSLVMGFMAGAVIGLAIGIFGGTLSQVRTISSVFGVVIGLVWSVVCLRMALNKKYREFRIVLVPRESEPG